MNFKPKTFKAPDLILTIYKHGNKLIFKKKNNCNHSATETELTFTHCIV